MRKFLGLMVLLVLLGLFSSRAQADQTYVTGMETTIETWDENVNLTVWQVPFSGTFIGDISGTITGDMTAYEIDGGTFDEYTFYFGEWTLTTNNSETYTGIHSSFEAPDDEGVALGGDIAAVSYNSDVFSIARIGNEQTTGTFSSEIVFDESNGTLYLENEPIILHIERNLYLDQGEGYYNGSIAAYMLLIYPDLPDNISFPNAGFALITYLCQWGDGEAFDVYWDEGGDEHELGALTSPLYGVFIPGEGPDDIIIEHAVPIPSTAFLLGSLVFGILVMRRNTGS